MWCILVHHPNVFMSPHPSPPRLLVVCLLFLARTFGENFKVMLAIAVFSAHILESNLIFICLWLPERAYAHSFHSFSCCSSPGKYHTINEQKKKTKRKRGRRRRKKLFKSVARFNSLHNTINHFNRFDISSNHVSHSRSYGFYFNISSPTCAVL